MLSLASTTGTGDLIGGDTLAGGGAAKAGDRGLPLGASVCAAVQRQWSYAVKRPRRTPGLLRTSSSLGYFPIATRRGAKPLLFLRARVCGVDVLARAAIARMAACKHTMSACKKHV